MKGLIRLFVIVFSSVKLTQYVIGGFLFGHPSAFLLYTFALCILYLLLKPILRLIALPSGGAGFLFMTFLLTFVTTQALTLFIPLFSIRTTLVSELIIFGFVLPSKQLTPMWASVFSSLLLTVFIWFFNWLCENKK